MQLSWNLQIENNQNKHDDLRQWQKQYFIWLSFMIIHIYAWD